MCDAMGVWHTHFCQTLYSMQTILIAFLCAWFSYAFEHEEDHRTNDVLHNQNTSRLPYSYAYSIVAVLFVCVPCVPFVVDVGGWIYVQKWYKHHSHPATCDYKNEHQIKRHRRAYWWGAIATILLQSICHLSGLLVLTTTWVFQTSTYSSTTPILPSMGFLMDGHAPHRWIGAVALPVILLGVVVCALTSICKHAYTWLQTNMKQKKGGLSTTDVSIIQFDGMIEDEPKEERHLLSPFSCTLK
jgi:hypothetical protein